MKGFEKIMIMNSGTKETSDRRSGGKGVPPGRVKLAEALNELLAVKDFNSITTAEISKTAGVNESLIYRYFKDKRGLLHHVLGKYLVAFNDELNTQIKKTSGALNKLKILIHGHIRMYDTNRVFAKILLLEVRNFPGYFESDTYQLVKSYGRLITAIINEGVESGEIRSDIPLSRIRNLILGGIEHFCMLPVIFGYEISSEALGKDLCDLIFSGIVRQPSG